MDTTALSKHLESSKVGQKFHIKKLLTSWIIDSKQPKMISLPETLFHLDFVKKAVSIKAAESYSKLLGISFPTDSLNESTWKQFKVCIAGY